ncbi:MAG: DUF5723 family protein [Lachnoclostridium sp.]|nr:DUF5723 family protein [Lachnoclostridium sp.]
MKSTYNSLRRWAAGLGAVIAVAGAASAQNLNSAYFTDGYLYRYQLNPAFANEKNFVSIPALGNINVGVNGTLHLKDVLYNVNGKTTTFLNPAVDTNEFLNNIGNNNRLGSDIRINVLSAGFKAFHGYNTITLGVRANVNAKLPRELFSLLKQGVENNTYNISDVRANATAWVELGLGHSHQINNQLRVGGTLKFLVGGGNLDAVFNDAQLQLTDNSWNAITNADLHSSVKGLTYKTDVNNNTGHRYVSGLDVDGTGINGYGLAFDLGASYRLNQDWMFSLSLLDLGFISWKNDMLASTNGTQKFESNLYTFNVEDDAPNSFDNEWDKIKDDVSALYELNDMGDQGGRTTALGATLNVAAEYTFPYYRKLTFGGLVTTRIQGDFSWCEARISANVAPVKIFSAGINMGMGSFGCSFGWILNLHCPGYNLFLATDHTPGKLAKQGAPLSSNANISLGMNVQF